MRESCDRTAEAAASCASNTPNKDHATIPHLTIAAIEDGEFVVDLYSWLGVPRHASADEIRQAYYARAMALHPDRNPDSAASAETLKSITRGASILRDPRTRKLYDRGDIDAAGRLTHAGADRRWRADVTRAFGLYFLGPFATGLAVVAALLWTQAPLKAGIVPDATTTTARSLADSPSPLAASAKIEDASLAPADAASGKGASAETPRIVKSEQRPPSVAPIVAATKRLDQPSRALVMPAAHLAATSTGSDAVAETAIASAEFEALAASAASDLAREIQRRVHAAKPAVAAKSVKGEMVSALKRARDQPLETSSTSVARKAPRPTVLALNGKPEPTVGEGHAFERPSCALTRACRADETMCGC